MEFPGLGRASLALEFPDTQDEAEKEATRSYAVKVALLSEKGAEGVENMSLTPMNFSQLGREGIVIPEEEIRAR